MKRLQLAVMALIMGLASCAQGPTIAITPVSTVLATAELSSTAQTFTVTTAGFKLVTVYLTTVADNSVAITATMTCTGLDDSGSAYTLQACDTSTYNVCSSGDQSWTKAGIENATTRWPWRIDVTGFKSITCSVVSGEASTSGDTVAVKASKVAN